jgi:hypothetical protein
MLDAAIAKLFEFGKAGFQIRRTCVGRSPKMPPSDERNKNIAIAEMAHAVRGLPLLPVLFDVSSHIEHCDSPL